ncbi:autotransporter domain-containing protein [Pseudovibrio denitrificans]|uniref:autotransporter family protein n=1 Tax=Pseudovibrio denitrificans TaxID=258256 RepID=UPI0039BFE38A
MSCFQNNAFAPITPSGMLVTVLLASASIPPYALADTIDISSLQDPVVVGTDIYDGSIRNRSALFYHHPASGDKTIDGSISMGSADAPVEIQNWDAATQSFTADIDELYLAGIRSARDVTSNVDISLFVSRGSGNSASDQSLELNGLYVDSGQVVSNTGTITLWAEADQGESTARTAAEASGIYGDIDENHGRIVVTARGGSGSSSATEALGIYGTVNTNTGDIIAVSIASNELSDGNIRRYADADAYGIADDVAVLNSGNITVEARGGKAATTNDRAQSDVEIYGIYGDVKKNTGDIKVLGISGTAKAVSGDAWADAEAYGIEGYVEENIGAISVIAKAGRAETVSGSIRVDAEAYGFYDNVEINRGDIYVEAIGGTAIGGTIGFTSRWVDSTAVGVDGYLNENHGTITIVSEGGHATVHTTTSARADAEAVGVASAKGTFLNTGIISATAIAGTINNVNSEADAIGVNLSGDTILDNQGLIKVTARVADSSVGGPGTLSAFQVDAGNNNLTVKSYGIAFNEQTASDYTGTIDTGSSGSVTFDDAVLYAHVTDETKEGEAYDVPVLVNGAAASAQFTSLKVGSGTDWKIAFVDGTSGTTNQQVILDYAPDSALPQLAAEQQTQVMIDTARITQNAAGNLLAGTSSGQSEKTITAGLDVKGQLYGSPYHLSQESSFDNGGYDAKTNGILVGYNHRFNSNLIVGVNGFYGQSELDYKGGNFASRSEDVSLYSLGGQITYKKNDVVLSAVSSYFHSENEQEDSAANHAHSAKYSTDALFNQASVQFIKTIGHHQFVPELGLIHRWLSRDAYTASVADEADVTYGSISDHDAYLTAKMSWSASYDWDDISIQPEASVGLRHALTDGTLSTAMMSGANGFEQVEGDSDKTHFTATAGVGVQGKSFGASIGFLGDFSKNTRSAAVYGSVSYRF